MVLGRQHAMADHAPDRRGTDSQSCGRFVDRHLTTLAAFAFAVRCNVLVVTQGADTHACPAIATASRLPRAVQNGGNRFIWHLTGEDPHQVDDVGIGYPTVSDRLYSSSRLAACDRRPANG